MKRVKRPELRLNGQKVRLKKKPVILAVSVLVLIVLLVSVSVHAASKKHTQKVSAGVAEETGCSRGRNNGCRREVKRRRNNDC